MMACMMVKQYVAEIVLARGIRFRVFRTGDDKFYLFDPCAPDGTSGCVQFPVLKSRLRNDIRRALANGVGYIEPKREALNHGRTA